ncbi:MAG: MFS transporter [Candidatus Promineifilaceae bacterium]
MSESTPANGQPPSMNIRQLLGLADFRFLWIGQIISNFGDSVTALTLILLINRATGGDTAAIAYLLIAMALPQATIGLVAGVFVDRWDRKRVMIFSDLVRGFLVLAFLLTGTAEHINLFLLYVIAFAHSAIGAFFTPARSAVIPLVIPKDGLLSANSLSQTSFVFFRLLGTAAAGFLVGALDVFWPAYVIDASTFFVSALFISRVALPPMAGVKEMGVATVSAVLGEMRAGFGLLVQSRILIGTLVAAGVAMLGLGAVNVLLAPMIVNDLKIAETWFGAIELSQVAGMIISGSLVAVLAARFKPTSMISGGLIGIGIGVALLALILNVWHLFIVLFIIGLMSTPLNSAEVTLIQLVVENEVMGRVSAALGAIIQVANLVSMFAAGTLAALVGVRNVFVIGGVMAIVAGFAAAAVFRGFEPPVKAEEAPTVQVIA